MAADVEHRIPTLKSIELENIGPFHSTHIEFTPQWNVLLGDNGVGKTIVLKAIAAALCGDRADTRAISKLLRVGAEKGSIRLRDEEREYSIELERELDGTVRIVSPNISPIIYHRWLVLGFPALRGVPSNSPAGPTNAKKQAPSPEDLLPLLGGWPDNRLANVKQWLVNLDYAAYSNTSSLDVRKIMSQFFGVLQRLTPDIQVRFAGIESRTMEIMVETDSGVVPLDLISQGTSAVMCWIGTLLQRLAEVNQSRDSALVLIDELDLHMHPAWQQAFVDLFRQEFPLVQVIATTHSPLLIGQLQRDEIQVVRRETATKDPVVVVERTDIDPMGMRMDEIFTSSLFGLESTLDPETLRMRERYTRLYALETRTEDEQAELNELAKRLRVRLANPQQTKAARMAFDLIEDFAKKRLAAIPTDQRQEILEEVRVQLTESITGSKRP